MTAPNLPTGSGSLHERERELAALEQAIIDAKADESRLVLIEGPAGIGKSRLLLEMRKMAEAAGFAVVTARGFEYERDYSLGMLRQLIGNAQREEGENEVSSNADAADELMAAFGGAGGEEPSTFAIFEGCYWATVRAAETTPILIAIDDLHWCDRPSLEYLSYLARRIESLPIVIAATVRPADSSAGAAAVRELMGDPQRLSILPRPLSAQAVAEIVAERLEVDGADSDFTAELVSITGGNPLLVDELLKELALEEVAPSAENTERLRELGPRAASRSVLLRLARLAPECKVVAQALTIFGEGASSRHLSEFTELDEATLAKAIAQNVQAEIFRPEQPLGFVHPLVREAIYRDIPAGERELAHTKAARQLDAAGESTQRVAAQLLKVPPRADEWVFEKLLHAGRVALSRHSLQSALSYLSRAMEEPPPRGERTALLRDLGLTESLINPSAASDKLLAAWDGFDDPLQRGFIATNAIRVLGLAQRNAEASELAERTLELLGPEHQALRQRIESGLLSVSLMAPQVRPFESLGPLLDDPSSRGDSVEARMVDGAACYGKMLRNDPADECVQLALRAVSDDSLFAYDNAGFPMIGVWITLATADDERVFEVCDRSIEFSGRGASPFYAAASARIFRGMAHVYRGDLQGAFEMLELARSDIELLNLRLGYSQVSALLTLACVEQGDLVRAERELSFGEPYLTEGIARIAWLGSKLHLRVEQGRNEEALIVCEKIEQSGFDAMIQNPAWLPWRSLKAEALDGLDRTDEAIALAEDEVAAARRWGRPRALGRALRVAGQLKRRDGMAELDEAVAVLEGSQVALEYAWSLAARGTALRHQRKAVDAREPLGEALKIAARAGASGLERHIRDELAASGAAPRASDFQGMGSLTPSERRAAKLAIEGMTNREIAQALFVTPKTIEVHLSNVYKKLEIKSRKELPSVFVE